MLRISTTDLESFRRILQTEYGNEAELIDKLRGEPHEPTWQMQAGSDWDLLLQQDPGSATDPATEYVRGPNGYWFHRVSVWAARKLIGPGVWQHKATRIFPSPLGDVEVVGVADHMSGRLVQENKAKFSTPDSRGYESSLQWRFYLLIHDASVVAYNLWHFTEPDDELFCELKDHVRFRQWRYVGLESDCNQWVADFVTWAESRNLLQFLDRKGDDMSVPEFPSPTPARPAATSPSPTPATPQASSSAAVQAKAEPAKSRAVDPEFAALRKIESILRTLPVRARRRVVEYLKDKSESEA